MTTPNVAQGPSRLALNLARLLDETGIFSREEWAEFLGISTPAISQWLHDKTLPRPDHLRSILDVLRDSDSVPASILHEFQELAASSAGSITPLASRLRLEPTIGHYMLRPVREGFLRLLSTLSSTGQERVLAQASKLCLDEAANEPLLLAKPDELWLHQRFPAFSTLNPLPARDLAEIFSYTWKKIVVIARKPREAFDHGTEAEYYRSLVSDFLGGTGSSCPDALTYVCPENHRNALAQGINQFLTDVIPPGSPINSATLIQQVTLATAALQDFENLMAQLSGEHSHPRVVVAFDLGEANAFGYAWHEDKSEHGIVLNRSQLATVQEFHLRCSKTDPPRSENRPVRERSNLKTHRG